MLFGNAILRKRFDDTQGVFMLQRLLSFVLVPAAILLFNPILLSQDTSSPQGRLPKIAFSAPQVISVPEAYTNPLTFGDFNNDGNTDILTQGGLLLGDGKGGFTVSSIDESLLVSQGYYLAVADVNGDGNLDVLQLQPGFFDTNHCDDEAGQVNVFLGDGKGSFTEFGYGEPIAPPGDTYAMLVGDFNHDGKPDVAFSEYNGLGPCNEPPSQGVFIYVNNGDGTFTNTQELNLAADQQISVTGDFNGDGNLDLALSYFGGPIQVLSGNGDGSFRTGPVYTLDSFLYNLAAGDLNGDKRTDLLAQVDNKGLNPKGTRIASLLAKETEGFYWSSNLNLPNVQTFVSPPADFNSDGKPDILLSYSYSYSSSAENSVQVFAGEGYGRFAGPQSFLVESALVNEFAFPLTTGAPPSILFRSVTSVANGTYQLGLLLNESK
jgi:hypothetical protein